MKQNILFPCLVFGMVLTFVGCQLESNAPSSEGVMSAMPKLGSEVENNGVKSRLFGCLPED